MIRYQALFQRSLHDRTGRLESLDNACSFVAKLHDRTGRLEKIKPVVLI